MTIDALSAHLRRLVADLVQIRDASLALSTPEACYCVAFGMPRPQGSMRFNGRRVVHDDETGRLAAWRTAVNAAAIEMALRRRIRYGAAVWPAGVVGLALVFWLPRDPAMDPALVLHDEAPDLDKLSRAVLDGLTGAMYRDDQQVQTLRAAKYWSAIDGKPGVEILAWREDLRV